MLPDGYCCGPNWGSGPGPGGSGIQFSPKDMEYAAELLGILTFDDDVRASVIAGQRRRLTAFSDARIERALVDVVAYSGGSYPS